MAGSEDGGCGQTSKAAGLPTQNLASPLTKPALRPYVTRLSSFCDQALHVWARMLVAMRPVGNSCAVRTLAAAFVDAAAERADVSDHVAVRI